MSDLENLKSIDIPENVNVYDEYCRIKDCDQLVAAINSSMKKHGVKPSGYSSIGNVVLRFSHMMGIQDEGEGLTLPPYPEDGDESDEAKEWRFIHYIADIYEDYLKQTDALDLSKFPDGSFTFRGQPGKTRI